LSGPTNFANIISQVNGYCAGKSMEESQYNQKYNILLILTDGAITDMNNTIDEIVRGSDLPLSIIIVGLGVADFSSMTELDADTEPLYSQKYGKYMSRDIVQFVPFHQYKSSPEALAKEVLREVPRQLTSYF